jgi:hypothetical protein
VFHLSSLGWDLLLASPSGTMRGRQAVVQAGVDRRLFLLFCEHVMKKTCFFVAPIGRPDSVVRHRSDRVLDVLIRPTLTRLGYRVIRIDRLAVMGSLSVQIRALLRQSDLVIADLTGANANVFYELGFRHATDKPCLQLIEEGEQIPFDVADIRTIFIDSSSKPRLGRAVLTLAEQVRAAETHHRAPVNAPSEAELAAYLSEPVALELESVDAPHSSQPSFATVELQHQDSGVAAAGADEMTDKQHDAPEPRHTTPARLPVDKGYLWRRFLPMAA